MCCAWRSEPISASRYTAGSTCHVLLTTSAKAQTWAGAFCMIAQNGLQLTCQVAGDALVGQRQQLGIVLHPDPGKHSICGSLPKEQDAACMLCDAGQHCWTCLNCHVLIVLSHLLSDCPRLTVICTRAHHLIDRSAELQRSCMQSMRHGCKASRTLCLPEAGAEPEFVCRAAHLASVGGTAREVLIRGDTSYHSDDAT